MSSNGINFTKSVRTILDDTCDKNPKLPQMRILVTDYCDSNCIYCRPSGEGNLGRSYRNIKYETATRAAAIYKANGGREIKISGGDPLFWPFLRNYLRWLKKDLQMEHMELITRCSKITDFLECLTDCQLDVLNFSLDTLEPSKYRRITGKEDYNTYINAIKYCASNISCKINMVVLNDTTLSDIECMTQFCIQNGIRDLKLLDYIDDIQEISISHKPNSKKMFHSIYEWLKNKSIRTEVIFQGGFGHPMTSFVISNDLRILCKDASKGAWYGNVCRHCDYFPCHDALMALRVTPADSFQLCLKNDKMHWMFDNLTIESQFQSILSVFQTAEFYSNENYSSHLSQSRV